MCVGLYALNLARFTQRGRREGKQASPGRFAKADEEAERCPLEEILTLSSMLKIEFVCKEPHIGRRARISTSFASFRVQLPACAHT